MCLPVCYLMLRVLKRVLVGLWYAIAIEGGYEYLVSPGVCGGVGVWVWVWVWVSLFVFVFVCLSVSLCVCL